MKSPKRISHFSHSRLLSSLVLFAVLAGLFVTLLTQSAPTQASSGQTGPVSGSQVARGKRIGQTDRNRKIDLTISLNVTNDAELEQLITSQYDPQSPNYKKFLTPKQYTDRFINQADRVALVNYFKGKGLAVNDSGTGNLVNVSGAAAQLETVFGVTLSDYKDSQTGEVFYSNDAEPVLPDPVKSKVKAVVGLSNATHYKPRFHQIASQPSSLTPRSNGTPSGGCQGAQSVANSSTSFLPNQLKTAYNFDPFYSQGISGTGQTVAVYELDDYLDSNVATYQACFGTAVPVKRMKVDGGVTAISNGQIEVELDIEVLAGMAPGLKQILVYEAPNTPAGYLDEFQQIANDNLAQVVSISWGDCESNYLPPNPTTVLDTESNIFKQMATQGQSVFSASGDTGSEICPPSTALDVSDVLDNQYVTGVGGTRLTLNTNNTIASEITWNDNTGASSGGISKYFDRPSWQTGPGTNNSYTNGKRMMPDVSAAGSPYTGYIIYTLNSSGTASWQVYGGTSASSPLWAAAVALTNNYLSRYNLPAFGFANPTLYRIFRAPASATVFHDITVGDNCYLGTTCGTPNTNSGTGTYPATTGFDMATGLGSLNAYNLARFNMGCSTPATTVDTGGDGSSGITLRTAINNANTATDGCKLVDLTNPAIGPTIILSNTGLNVGPGVVLLGPPCSTSGPTLTISGLGIPPRSVGLTINGAILTGLQISGFNKQIVANQGNFLDCIKAAP